MRHSADAAAWWMCREVQKEKELLEKKLQRLEQARAAEIAQLAADLQTARDDVASQLSAKDAKV